MLRFVHCPKTGGVALRNALAPLGPFACDGHMTRLSTVQPDDWPIITITRDPLPRFVSAFWWLATKTFPWPWRTPDAMVERMGTPLVDKAFKRYMVLWPQTHWLDCDTPLDWVGHTETLGEDVKRLEELLSATITLTPRNVGRYPHVPLSSASEDRIREFYAADYTYLEDT